jgi:hypothetical protein
MCLRRTRASTARMTSTTLECAASLPVSTDSIDQRAWHKIADTYPGNVQATHRLRSSSVSSFCCRRQASPWSLWATTQSLQSDTTGSPSSDLSVRPDPPGRTGAAAIEAAARDRKFLRVVSRRVSLFPEEATGTASNQNQMREHRPQFCPQQFSAGDCRQSSAILRISHDPSSTQLDCGQVAYAARNSRGNRHTLVTDAGQQRNENVFLSCELKEFNGIEDESHYWGADTRGKRLGALEC